MGSKIFRPALLFIVITAALQNAAGQLPIRYWGDDMASHTFSLGLGPGFFSRGNPIFGNEGISNENVVPVGMEVALRYDWAYFRGFEVALGTGATYIFSTYSSTFDPGNAYRGEIKTGDAFHYIGLNAVDTKIWFGKRTVWDVCIHMGYMGGSSWIKNRGVRQTVGEHGFMAGLSTGFDFLVTAWLGVGVHMNVMTGVLYPTGYSSSREYTRFALRVGAVYCF